MKLIPAMYCKDPSMFQERSESRDENLGLLANGSSGPWDVAIDETISGDERWFAQIEGPSVYLYFEIPSPSIVRKVGRFLASPRDKAAPTHYSSSNGELSLGKPQEIPVTLVRDDEYEDRCFIVVGQSDSPIVRFGFAGEDLQNIVEAFRQVDQDIELYGDVDYSESMVEYRGNPNIEVLSDLLKGESPRCAVIVSTAFFEELLRDLLQRKNGDFSLQLKNALEWGLLSQNEYSDLNILRELRNRFAHDLRAKDFDPSSATKVIALKTWQIAADARPLDRVLPTPLDRLLFVVGTIALRLQKRKKPTNKNGPLPEPEIADFAAWAPVVTG